MGLCEAQLYNYYFPSVSLSLCISVSLSVRYAKCPTKCPTRCALHGRAHLTESLTLENFSKIFIVFVLESSFGFGVRAHVRACVHACASRLRNFLRQKKLFFIFFCIGIIFLICPC